LFRHPTYFPGAFLEAFNHARWCLFKINLSGPEADRGGPERFRGIENGTDLHGIGKGFHLTLRTSLSNLVIMKVKVGQLKAKLSYYLRKVEETQEAVEVCVRETPVAYLNPIREGQRRGGGQEIEELLASGLVVTPAKTEKGNWAPKPEKAADGRVVENSVVAMREEKDW